MADPVLVVEERMKNFMAALIYQLLLQLNQLLIRQQRQQ